MRKRKKEGDKTLEGSRTLEYCCGEKLHRKNKTTNLMDNKQALLKVSNIKKFSEIQKKRFRCSRYFPPKRFLLDLY